MFAQRNYDTHSQLVAFFSVCILGKRLLKDIPVENCTKEIDGPLYDIFCQNRVCDPYFNAHNTSVERGIKGLKSGVFWNNLYPYFLDYGQYIAQSKDADHIETMGRPTYNQIYADLTTAFTILIGIFFPSVTGEFRRSSVSHNQFTNSSNSRKKNVNENPKAQFPFL
jgi:hypothetical protein